MHINFFSFFHISARGIWSGFKLKDDEVFNSSGLKEHISYSDFCEDGVAVNPEHRCIIITRINGSICYRRSPCHGSKKKQFCVINHTRTWVQIWYKIHLLSTLFIEPNLRWTRWTKRKVVNKMSKSGQYWPLLGCVFPGFRSISYHVRLCACMYMLGWVKNTLSGIEGFLSSLGLSFLLAQRLVLKNGL